MWGYIQRNCVEFIQRQKSEQRKVNKINASQRNDKTSINNDKKHS